MSIKDPVQILVNRTGALGDVLLTTGVIRDLKRQYAESGMRCEIDVRTEFPELFIANPYVRDIYPRRDLNHYERLLDFDLAYEQRPDLHVIDAYARIAGVNRERCRPELFGEVAPFTDLPEQYVTIHMRNHHWANRNLPENFWIELIGRIISDTDLAVVQIGGGTDLSFGEIEGRLYNRVGQYSVHETYAAIQSAQAFVGVDAGSLHIAACTETPILGLFTAVRAEYREPIGRRAPHINVAADIDCYGCVEGYERPLTTYRCDRGDEECTRRFNADAVFEKFKLLLEKSQ